MTSSRQTCSVQFDSFCSNWTNRGTMPARITSSIGGFGSASHINNFPVYHWVLQVFTSRRLTVSSSRTFVITNPSTHVLTLVSPTNETWNKDCQQNTVRAIREWANFGIPWEATAPWLTFLGSSRRADVKLLLTYNAAT